MPEENGHSGNMVFSNWHVFCKNESVNYMWFVAQSVHLMSLRIFYRPLLRSKRKEMWILFINIFSSHSRHFHYGRWIVWNLTVKSADLQSGFQILFCFLNGGGWNQMPWALERSESFSAAGPKCSEFLRGLLVSLGKAAPVWGTVALWMVWWA